MAKLKFCHWNCGRKTDRICGICLHCCNERDERNKRIDAGLEAYVPPQDRPGHRLYERKNKSSEARRAALAKATASRMAKFDDQIASTEV